MSYVRGAGSLNLKSGQERPLGTTSLYQHCNKLTIWGENNLLFRQVSCLMKPVSFSSLRQEEMGIHMFSAVPSAAEELKSLLYLAYESRFPFGSDVSFGFRVNEQIQYQRSRRLIFICHV
jgi:hypothetical protein